jgi:hypothetical protein
MKWLGHFEFGENFKPINYGGWLNKGVDLSCIDEEFWMQYWIAAYTYLLTHKSRNVFLIDFDELLCEGRPYLERISEYVGIIHKEKLIEGSRTLRLPTTHSQDRHSWSSSTWNAAQDVYTELRRLAI